LGLSTGGTKIANKGIEKTKLVSMKKGKRNLRYFRGRDHNGQKNRRGEKRSQNCVALLVGGGKCKRKAAKSIRT